MSTGGVPDDDDPFWGDVFVDEKVMVGGKSIEDRVRERVAVRKSVLV